MELKVATLNTFLVQSCAKDRPQLLISLTPLPPHGRLITGRLFALAEVASDATEIRLAAQTFINQLFKQFQELSTADVETAFEHTLEWANQQADELVSAELKCHLCLLLGCLKEDQIQFALTGPVLAYIIFKEKEGWRNLDLVKNYLPKEKTKAPGRTGLFFDLISGNLHPENFMLFGNTALLDFLTADRLQKIIVGRPAALACSYLEKILNQLDNRSAFGGLILAYGYEPIKETPGAPKKIGSITSIRRLVSREEETARILSPSFWSSFKKIFTFERQPKNPASEIDQVNVQTLKKITQIYQALENFKRNSGTAITGLGRGFNSFLIAVGRAIFNFFIRLLQLFKNPAAILKESHYHFKIFAQQKLFWLKQKFMAWPLKRRLIFSVLSLALIILIVSLGTTFYLNHKQLAEADYNQLVNDIKNKLDEADSSLIYRNEDHAWELLKQIQTSLASFPCASSNHEQMYERFMLAAATLASQLRHQTTITPGVELDLSKEIAGWTPTDLIVFGQDFLLLEKGSGRAFFYEKQTKQLNSINDQRLGSFKNKTILANNTALILTSANSLFLFDATSQAFETQEITLANLDAQIQNIALYSQRLYALDIKNNQITKHNPTATGFSKGAYWLKNNREVNLTDVSDLTLDGSLYLAKNNGEILKYEKGQRISFDLSRLEPGLKNATKIYTQIDSDKLFILDPGQKRIIVWNKKTKKADNQFISPDFTDLKDFSVNEKEKKIYILNGQKILSIKY